VTGCFGPQEYRQLQQAGYLRLDSMLEPAEIESMRAVFGTVWAAGDAVMPETRCWVLAWEPFRAVLRSPRLVSMLSTIFDGQAQLLDYYPNYQPAMAGRQAQPREHVSTQRDWHRDFTFVRSPDGLPLMITVLIFVDDVTEDMGPTLVLPGTHRIPAQVVTRHDSSPRADELPLPVRAGEGLVLNSSIIHSRGLNNSDRPRRGVVLNFGYWWMKPWDMDLPLPEDARTGNSAEVEQLLGLRCPGDNLYLVSSL
jgi:hypothetical protein